MERVANKITVSVNRLRKVFQWARMLVDAAKRSRSTAYAATSMDLCDAPNLAVMLGGNRPTFYSRIVPSAATTLIGWGRKWSGRRAHALSSPQRACVLVEDGFLRSVGRYDDACGIVFDRVGIYYDATQPSEIESLIQVELNASQTTQAQSIMALWRHERVSKYNDMPDYAGQLPANYVLVIDQVANDLSISFGMADPRHFTAMLQSALDENPDATIILKCHPDTANDPTKGHFDLKALANNPRVHVIATPCHPVDLIANARAVYTVTSQMGFEALIWAKPVHCFGVPFYAGYGLTNDRRTTPDRRAPATLTQLVHAALVRYPRFVHPETAQLSDAAALIHYLGQQRRLMQPSSDPIYAIGFSTWKQGPLQKFLAGRTIRHVKAARSVPDGAQIAVWGNRDIHGLQPSHRVLRLEDGFMRSAGLGADLIKPLSWAIDDLGIYFDPSQPSRLEVILGAQNCDAGLSARARALRETLIALGISKYNIGETAWAKPPKDRQVILVPGQVENDASIVAGTQNIRTNLDLLQKVRHQNPKAYIIYKPHPDVVAGLRHDRSQNQKMQALCDQIVTHVDPAVMFAHIDEVHTMTSLMGFEALIRGVSVTCYGQPFYAGWGLTNDIAPIARRTAKLSIDELVAGALITYPRYLSRQSGRLTTPEQAIADLSDWRKTDPKKVPFIRKVLRMCLRFWAASGLRRRA